jgi:hypothetical protein
MPGEIIVLVTRSKASQPHNEQQDCLFKIGRFYAVRQKTDKGP